MKRKLCVLALSVILMLAAASCTAVSSVDTKDVSMFVVVENTSLCTVVFHRDTGVMYAVSRGSNAHGAYTMLVNADGTPMIYNGGE